MKLIKTACLQLPKFPHFSFFNIRKRCNYLEPLTSRNPVGTSTEAQKEKPHNSDWYFLL